MRSLALVSRAFAHWLEEDWDCSFVTWNRLARGDASPTWADGHVKAPDDFRELYASRLQLLHALM